MCRIGYMECKLQSGTTELTVVPLCLQGKAGGERHDDDWVSQYTSYQVLFTLSARIRKICWSPLVCLL
jgi:hypothetical protein